MLLKEELSLKHSDSHAANVAYVTAWDAAIEFAASNFNLDDEFYYAQVRESILKCKDFPAEGHKSAKTLPF